MYHSNAYVMVYLIIYLIMLHIYCIFIFTYHILFLQSILQFGYNKGGLLLFRILQSNKNYLVTQGQVFDCESCQE